MNNLNLLLLMLFTFIVSGCDFHNAETLTNAQIISFKTECEKAGMDYLILNSQGNFAHPYKVICMRPEHKGESNNE